MFDFLGASSPNKKKAPLNFLGFIFSFRLRLIFLPVVLVIFSTVVITYTYQKEISNIGQQAQILTEQYSQDHSENVQMTLTVLSSRLILSELHQAFAAINSLADLLSELAALDQISSTDAIDGLENYSPANEGDIIFPLSDASFVFIPLTTKISPSVQRDVTLSQFLDVAFPGIAKTVKGFRSAFWATPQNLLWIYSGEEYLSEVPPVFQVTRSEWYQISLNNDQGAQIYWFGSSEFPLGGEDIYLIASPIYSHQESLLGIIGIQVNIDEFAANLMASEHIFGGSYFMIDREGKIILLPINENQTQISQGVYSLLENLNLDAPPVENQSLPGAMTGRTGLVKFSFENTNFAVSFAPIGDTGLSVGYIVDRGNDHYSFSFLQNELIGMTQSLLGQRIFPILLVLLIAMTILGYFIINHLFDPIQKLAAAAQRIVVRDWDAPLPQNAPGEIGVLVDAFRSMKEELHNSLTNLENRISERTQVLAKRSIQLQTSAEVAREVTATRNFDVLLLRTVNLIVDRFGFYFAGIYLLDSQSEYAELQAAPGEIGQTMLTQGHRLRIGHSSLVGYVASTGDPKIVLNALENPGYYRNPLLPETKSEIALPLVVNQKVIGVLDVHSQEVNAFTQDDADVLQTLADELAFAIDNARLFQQFQETKRQLTSLQNQISKDVWVGLSQTIQVAGYQLDASGIHPVFNRQFPTDQVHAPFSIPVKVRGEVVAWLDLWPREDTLAPGELDLLNAVKERLTQAVESARIFEETQRRAGREQAVNEFVTALSGSLDLDVLLTSAVKNLGRIPDVTEVRLSLQDPHTVDPIGESDISHANDVTPGSEEV